MDTFGFKKSTYLNKIKLKSFKNIFILLLIIFFRFYWPLFLIFGILLPINAPAEYWGESIANSVLVLGFLRFAVLSNMTWLIHSGILIWGLKPHEKLKSILDTYTLLFKLFIYKPRSHSTVVIDDQGVYSQYIY